MPKNNTAAIWRSKQSQHRQMNAAVAAALNAELRRNPNQRAVVYTRDVMSQVRSMPVKQSFMSRLVQRVRALV